MRQRRVTVPPDQVVGLGGGGAARLAEDLFHRDGALVRAVEGKQPHTVGFVEGVLPVQNEGCLHLEAVRAVVSFDE